MSVEHEYQIWEGSVTVFPRPKKAIWYFNFQFSKKKEFHSQHSMFSLHPVYTHTHSSAWKIGLFCIGANTLRAHEHPSERRGWRVGGGAKRKRATCAKWKWTKYRCKHSSIRAVSIYELPFSISDLRPPRRKLNESLGPFCRSCHSASLRSTWKSIGHSYACEIHKTS